MELVRALGKNIKGACVIIGIKLLFITIMGGGEKPGRDNRQVF